MDLRIIDEVLADRAAKWKAAGLSWEVVRSDYQGRAAVSLRAESPSRVAELIVWDTGDADIIHAELTPRVTDPTTDHYELTTKLGLDGCLDDFEGHMGI